MYRVYCIMDSMPRLKDDTSLSNIIKVIEKLHSSDTVDMSNGGLVIILKAIKKEIKKHA